VGVAVDLNEPVWLWPEHTMRTSAKEWPVAELSVAQLKRAHW
jgi:hypothetical protein